MMNNGYWRTRKGETPSKKSHAKIIDTWVEKNPELRQPQDKLAVKERVVPKYKTEIRKREEIYRENTKPMPADSNTIGSGILNYGCSKNNAKINPPGRKNYSISSRNSRDNISKYGYDRTEGQRQCHQLPHRQSTRYSCSRSLHHMEQNHTRM